MLRSMLGLARPKTADEHVRLPRGPCRFILLHPEITGQRCSCQGFFLNDAVPGSSCACGHQACYHVAEPPAGESVSREQHEALLRRVARLEANLDAEQIDVVKDRVLALEEAVDRGHHVADEGHQAVQRAIQGVYGHLAQLRRLVSDRFVQQEDRIEGLMDRVASMWDELRSLHARVVAIDDITMELEDRMSDLCESDDVRLTEKEASSRAAQGPPEAMVAILPPAAAAAAAMEEKEEEEEEGGGRQRPTPPWTAQVIFSPSPSRTMVMQPFREGSMAYRRCASRGLLRQVNFPDGSSHAFRRTIEEEFGRLLSGRRWMPLACKAFDPSTSGTSSATTSGGSGVVLDRLPEHLRRDDLWDVHFLAQHCADPHGSREEMQLLHVTFRDEIWTWEEIRALPAPEGGEDEESWRGPGWREEKGEGDGRSMEMSWEEKEGTGSTSSSKGRSSSVSSNRSYRMEKKSKGKRRMSDDGPTRAGMAAESMKKKIRAWVDGERRGEHGGGGGVLKMYSSSSSTAVMV